MKKQYKFRYRKSDNQYVIIIKGTTYPYTETYLKNVVKLTQAGLMDADQRDIVLFIDMLNKLVLYKCLKSKTMVV